MPIIVATTDIFFAPSIIFAWLLIDFPCRRRHVHYRHFTRHRFAIATHESHLSITP